MGFSGDRLRARRDSKRIPGLRRWRTSGLLWRAPRAGRLDEAEREALRGERLRRSPPAHRRSYARAARARAGAHRAIAAGKRRPRPQTRAKGDRGISRPGAATCNRGLHRARPDHRRSECRKRPPRRGTKPSRACCAAVPRDRSLPTRVAARLYISLNTVKTHTRELYRKLDATSRADAVARAEALGLLERAESPG